MLYIYIAGVAAFLIISLIVGIWLLKGRSSNVINTLAWSLISISLVTLLNIFWGGFVSNFYWGHSNAPSQNYLNVAARLICKSSSMPDFGCRLEKGINSYNLIIPDEVGLSEEEIKEINYRSNDAGILLFLIDANYGKHIHIESH